MWECDTLEISPVYVSMPCDSTQGLYTQPFLSSFAAESLEEEEEEEEKEAIELARISCRNDSHRKVESQVPRVRQQTHHS